MANKEELSLIQRQDLVDQAERQVGWLRKRLVERAVEGDSVFNLQGMVMEIGAAEAARDTLWLMVRNENTPPDASILARLANKCGTTFEIRDEETILRNLKEKNKNG